MSIVIQKPSSSRLKLNIKQYIHNVSICIFAASPFNIHAQRKVWIFWYAMLSFIPFHQPLLACFPHSISPHYHTSPAAETLTIKLSLIHAIYQNNFYFHIHSRWNSSRSAWQELLITTTCGVIWELTINRILWCKFFNDRWMTGWLTDLICCTYQGGMFWLSCSLYLGMQAKQLY